MVECGQFVRDAEVLGRPGKDLMNVIWPTPEIRFVASQLFHPYSGEPKIAIRVLAPELRERPGAKVIVPHKRSTPYVLEVHFAQRDYQFAELFANKCLIVLSAAEIEKQQMTREDFYNRACTLLRNDLHKGLMKPGKRTTVTREHVAELKDRDRVSRKSF